MQPSHQKVAGFTLLEVLIAISIFALIGLGGYRMLDIIITSQSRVEHHTETLRKTERAMYLISKDFEQFVNRPVRDNYADKLASIISPQQNYLVEFTRQGWRNPLQLPRSQLQRVAYELGSTGSSRDKNENGKVSGTHLLRHYWNVLDRAQDSKPQTQVLLKNIDDLQIRFLSTKGTWHSRWPDIATSDKETITPPDAIELEINTPTLGKIRRLFQLSEVSKLQTVTLKTSPKDENTKKPVASSDDYNNSNNYNSENNASGSSNDNYNNSYEDRNNVSGSNNSYGNSDDFNGQNNYNNDGYGNSDDFNGQNNYNNDGYGNSDDFNGQNNYNNDGYGNSDDFNGQNNYNNDGYGNSDDFNGQNNYNNNGYNNYQ